MKGCIWGYTLESSIEKLKEIEERYNQIGIQSKRKVKSINNNFIEFSNGDIWKAVCCLESHRGQRVNISYVDRRIDSLFINTIIDHCTTAMPYNAIRYY